MQILDDMKQNRIGVMQGRLGPKYKNKFQAHPVDYWQQEFLIAKSLGIDLIEFIFDDNCVEDSPLMSPAGIDEIKTLTDSTGVGVETICADYFMSAPLHSADPLQSASSVRYLRRLVENAVKLGVNDIVIPCVDQSALRSEREIERFASAMASVLDDVEKAQINLSLETDLNPLDFSSLLERLDYKRVTVNYDVGNSAALGYDPFEEFAAYGNKITDVHIKDRLRNGGSVLLGTGNANFELIFQLLNKISYRGPFILQVYRDDQGIEIFKKQLDWFHKQTATHYSDLI
jgi:L-ribulose-5-phosphate 3-epimerase